MISSFVKVFLQVQLRIAGFYIIFSDLNFERN
jgi:hypothetical protein